MVKISASLGLSAAAERPFVVERSFLSRATAAARLLFSYAAQGCARVPVADRWWHSSKLLRRLERESRVHANELSFLRSDVASLHTQIAELRKLAERHATIVPAGPGEPASLATAAAAVDAPAFTSPKLDVAALLARKAALKSGVKPPAAPAEEADAARAPPPQAIMSPTVTLDPAALQAARARLRAAAAPTGIAASVALSTGSAAVPAAASVPRGRNDSPAAASAAAAPAPRLSGSKRSRGASPARSGRLAPPRPRQRAALRGASTRVGKPAGVKLHVAATPAFKVAIPAAKVVRGRSYAAALNGAPATASSAPAADPPAAAASKPTLLPVVLPSDAELAAFKAAATAAAAAAIAGRVKRAPSPHMTATAAAAPVATAPSLSVVAAVSKPVASSGAGLMLSPQLLLSPLRKTGLVRSPGGTPMRTGTRGGDAPSAMLRARMVARVKSNDDADENAPPPAPEAVGVKPRAVSRPRRGSGTEKGLDNARAPSHQELLLRGFNQRFARLRNAQANEDARGSPASVRSFVSP